MTLLCVFPKPSYVILDLNIYQNNNLSYDTNKT